MHGNQCSLSNGVTFAQPLDARLAALPASDEPVIEVDCLQLLEESTRKHSRHNASKCRSHPSTIVTKNSTNPTATKNSVLGTTSMPQHSENGMLKFSKLFESVRKLSQILNGANRIIVFVIISVIL